MRSNGARRAYVETYGCQMNISDGELMEGILAKRGYEIVDAPEAGSAFWGASHSSFPSRESGRTCSSESRGAWPSAWARTSWTARHTWTS
jgi:hypothetical protein